MLLQGNGNVYRVKKYLKQMWKDISTLFKSVWGIRIMYLCIILFDTIRIFCNSEKFERPED